MKLIITTFLFFLVNQILLNAQVPFNILPNYGFEQGNYNGIPPCNNNIIGLSNWSLLIRTPDWRDSFNSVACRPRSFDCPNYQMDGAKYVFIGRDNDSPEGEALVALLSSSLQEGKKYKIRLWALGRIGDIFTTHLSKIKAKNIGIQSETMMNVLTGTIPFYTPDTNNRVCDAFAYETILTVDKKDLKYFVISTNGGIDGNCFLRIDNVELYEYCTEYIIRQGRKYKHPTELEEAANIIAGGKVNGIHLGDVEMKEGSITKYKASREVLLVEGFNVERGADFTANIAPCGKECASTNIDIPVNYAVCDNNCIEIGVHNISGMNYVWTSAVPDHINYLSAANKSKVVFCPPEGVTSGVFAYNLTVTNGCGESTTKTIYVRLTEELEPDIEIQSHNINPSTVTPEMELKAHPETEYITVDIMDCDGNVLVSQQLVNGVDFTNDMPFTYKYTGALNPCGCYQIRIRSKNFCNTAIKEEIVQWNRATSPTADVGFFNVVSCENGVRKLCFKGVGYAQIHIELFNRWGNNVLNQQTDVNATPFCIEVPNNLSPGVYAIIVSFIGCNGSVVTQHGFVTIWGNCPEALLDDGNEGEWVGDTYFSDVYFFNEETGITDSLYASVFPNPVTNGATISYHIPKEGHVKISILNSNFEQQSILINQEDVQKGDYEIQFSNNDLLNGVNYYMIELNNDQTARVIQRFSVIH
jgi:hypothetical protein